MKIYRVNEQIIYPENHGFFSFIYREPHLLDQVKADYKRDGIALKIFFKPLQSDLESYLYGNYFVDASQKSKSSLLLESVKVQNICAFEGLAPKVFGIELLEYNGYTFPMLIVEDVGLIPEWDIRNIVKIWQKLLTLSKKYGFEMGNFDSNAGNAMSGKWLDFQGFSLGDKYVEKLKKRLTKSAIWSGNHYQSVPKIGLDGFRKTDIRIKELGLDRINFEGAQVLDIGCSGGEFSMYALEHGASYVLGADFPSVIEGTREIANYLGCFNIDWHGINVLESELDYQADITFYLSMFAHIGLLDWVVKATRKIMIFETNGTSEQEAVEMLKKHFSRVEVIGYASDFDGRSIIHCYK